MNMKNELNSQVSTYSGNLYDFDNEILLNWYPNRILEITSDSKSLLELGVGHGYSSNVFSTKFERHLALDGSSAVIENFARKFPDCDVEIIETYFEDFESDEKFDVIVLGFILEHVDDPVAILDKYRNFLSHDGRMFISVPNAEALNRRIGHLAGMLPDMQALSEFDISSGHQRFYTMDSLTNEINEAGCEIVKMEGIYLKPLTTKQMLSLDLSEELIAAFCKVGVNYPELSLGLLAEIKGR